MDGRLKRLFEGCADQLLPANGSSKGKEARTKTLLFWDPQGVSGFWSSPQFCDVTLNGVFCRLVTVINSPFVVLRRGGGGLLCESLQ